MQRREGAKEGEEWALAPAAAPGSIGKRKRAKKREKWRRSTSVTGRTSRELGRAESPKREWIGGGAPCPCSLLVSTAHSLMTLPPSFIRPFAPSSFTSRPHSLSPFCVFAPLRETSPSTHDSPHPPLSPFCAFAPLRETSARTHDSPHPLVPPVPRFPETAGKPARHTGCSFCVLVSALCVKPVSRVCPPAARIVPND